MAAVTVLKPTWAQIAGPSRPDRPAMYPRIEAEDEQGRELERLHVARRRRTRAEARMANAGRMLAAEDPLGEAPEVDLLGERRPDGHHDEDQERSSSGSVARSVSDRAAAETSLTPMILNSSQ